MNKLNNISKGKQGEKLAFYYLEKNGYKVIEKNYYSQFGEIDIIAQKDGRYSFVEVKTRFNNNFGSGEDAFSPTKRDRFQKTIDQYLTTKEIETDDYSIELISILIDLTTHKAKLRHIKNVI